jgi:SAM-dependent methyltransferase
VRWTHKARIQRFCAATPRGDVAYRLVQRRFGSLTDDPFKRLPLHLTMVQGLRDLGRELTGARCLEVGTGIVPVAPVAFHLVGAREVVTVDLHRRLDLGLTRRMLARLAGEHDWLTEAYSGLVSPDVLRERLAVVGQWADRPLELFERIGVRYVAPGDAARLPHADGTVDLHFSMTVLEHVEPRALGEILREARRVLTPAGVAVHFVDPSDHFAHQDPSIARINFLQFDEGRWHRLAGNPLSYANRLRASQLAAAFADAGLRIDRLDSKVDKRSLAAVRAGFPLAQEFRHLGPEDLCTTTWRAYARPV